jgi:hypothetical protein
VNSVNKLCGKGKDKTIPVHAWTGPEGSRKLRLPDFKITYEGGKVVSPKYWLPLYPQEIVLVLISVEVESNTGPACGRKI